MITSASRTWLTKKSTLTPPLPGPVSYLYTNQDPTCPKITLTTPLPGPVGCLYTTQASLHPFQDLWLAYTPPRTQNQPHYTPSRTCGLLIHHPGPKVSLTTPLPGPVGCFYTAQASLHPFQDLALTRMVGDGRLEGELVVHRP